MDRTETTKHGVVLTLNKPLTDEAHVEAFEAKLGRRLPDSYRAFLLSYNGGRPKPSVFRFVLKNGKQSDSSVHWFLSLHEGEHSNLERELRSLKGRIPPDTLPIAIDPFGNVVLLGISGETRGKIYFWDHEEEPASQPNWSNVDLIADNLDSFMQGLRAS